MKNPAFQFYVQDFLMGTMAFSTEEIGAYILLLCHQWDKGFIEESEVEFVARMPIQKLSRVFQKFVKKNGRLRNKKLESVRDQKKKFSETQAGKGKKGAEARWHRPSPGHSPGHDAAIENGWPENGSSTSTSTSTSTSEKKEERKAPTDILFERFRRSAGAHISDEELIIEIGKFKNKYPNTHINQAGVLINAWVGNIGKRVEFDKKDPSHFV